MAGWADAAVAAMTDLIARHVDVPAVVAAAAARVPGAPWRPDVVGDPVTGAPTVAVAAGPAFSFGYPEHAEMLRAAGAWVVEFNPMAERLPQDTAALVLPGGFPEQYPGELSGNVALRADIRALARQAPVHAECAGLTYLMTDLDGHPMCDVLHGSARFTERLTLGYRDAAVTESPVHTVGQRVTGHEFHRTTVDFAQEYPPAWAYRGTGSAPVARARCTPACMRRICTPIPSPTPWRRAGSSPTPQPLGSPGDRERLPRRCAAGR